MRRLISIFMILNIVLVVFSVTDLQNVSAVAGCCVSGGCIVTADQDSCDGGNWREGQSCSYVNECKPVCCIDSDGRCYSDKSLNECNFLEGSSYSSNSNCNEVDRCGAVCCIIGSNVDYGITEVECRQKAQMVGATPEIKKGLASLEACRQEVSNKEGCCITPSGCVRTYDSQCTGEFRGDLLCSAPDLGGVCGYSKQYEKACLGGNVVWKDSQGNFENVVGVYYDGRIHNRLKDIEGKEGHCDISKNERCGKIGNGFGCVDLNCDVGDVFTLDTDYDQELGVFLEKEEIKIDREMLGLVGKVKDQKGQLQIYQIKRYGLVSSLNKVNRLNGESWCMPPKKVVATEDFRIKYDGSHKGDDNEKDFLNVNDRVGAEPGESHYVYRCVDGRIEVEACDAKRGSICDEVLGEDGLSHAGPVDNEWENCKKVGGEQDKCFPRGHCTFSSAGRNECFPRYPPGFEHWDEAKAGEYNQLLDSLCGKGWSNRCDHSECVHLGDANYGGGLHWSWKNFAIGLGIGVAVLMVVLFPEILPFIGEEAVKETTKQSISALVLI